MKKLGFYKEDIAIITTLALYLEGLFGELAHEGSDFKFFEESRIAFARENEMGELYEYATAIVNFSWRDHNDLYLYLLHEDEAYCWFVGKRSKMVKPNRLLFAEFRDGQEIDFEIFADKLAEDIPSLVDRLSQREW
jgi:hypothetical protein